MYRPSVKNASNGKFAQQHLLISPSSPSFCEGYTAYEQNWLLGKGLPIEKQWEATCGILMSASRKDDLPVCQVTAHN